MGQIESGRELRGCAFLWLGLGAHRRVAGCSLYYPQAIWVGRLMGCGGIHVGLNKAEQAIMLKLCLLSPTYHSVRPQFIFVQSF